MTKQEIEKMYYVPFVKFIHPVDVYGDLTPIIIKAFEKRICAFRIPQLDDVYVYPSSKCVTATATGTGAISGPRFIIKPRVVITFTETGEFRPPLKNEFFHDCNNMVYQAYYDGTSPGNIMTRTVTEA